MPATAAVPTPQPTGVSDGAGGYTIRNLTEAEAEELGAVKPTNGACPASKEPYCVRDGDGYVIRNLTPAEAEEMGAVKPTQDHTGSDVCPKGDEEDDGVLDNVPDPLDDEGGGGDPGSRRARTGAGRAR